MSKMRSDGVQNAGEKNMESENTSQSSQTSQYSQTHCTDRVSKMRSDSVQNAGVESFAPLADPANAGEKSMEPGNTSQSSQSSQYSQTHYADMVSKMNVAGVQNGGQNGQDATP